MEADDMRSRVLSNQLYEQSARLQRQQEKDDYKTKL
jgi:hypothetical protein